MIVKLLAPVAGSVWKIERQAGEQVRVGETVMVVECMKMEVMIESQSDGVLVSINAQEGHTIDQGQVLALIQTAEPEPVKPKPVEDDDDDIGGGFDDLINGLLGSGK